MKKTSFVVMALCLLLTHAIIEDTRGQVPPEETVVSAEVDSLVILWTTAEKEVLTKMLSVYVTNALTQGWFDHVTFIIWGPSAKLLAEDQEVQEWIRKFKEAGAVLEACLWCTNEYDVTEALEECGVDVRGMGRSLTEYLKDPDKKVIVF